MLHILSDKVHLNNQLWKDIIKVASWFIFKVLK